MRPRSKEEIGIEELMRYRVWEYAPEGPGHDE